METHEPTMKQGGQKLGQPSTASKPEPKLEPEKPKRKPREKPVVRIYKKQPGGQFGTYVPVPGSSGAEPMTFLSTQEAYRWIRSNLKEQGAVYQVVTVQKEFKLKIEQVQKVIMES